MAPSVAFTGGLCYLNTVRVVSIRGRAPGRKSRRVIFEGESARFVWSTWPATAGSSPAAVCYRPSRCPGIGRVSSASTGCARWRRWRCPAASPRCSSGPGAARRCGSCPSAPARAGWRWSSETPSFL